MRAAAGLAARTPLPVVDFAEVCLDVGEQNGCGLSLGKLFPILFGKCDGSAKLSFPFAAIAHLDPRAGDAPGNRPEAVHGEVILRLGRGHLRVNRLRFAEFKGPTSR